MKLKKIYPLFFFILVLSSIVSAVPGIPHQFYGDVYVNGQPAPDNNVIVAKIEGDSYTTVTKDGSYGYAPNIFYVEDPESDRAGKTITFFIGGKEAGTYVFENNGYTNLDFSLTTTCGDDYCLGDETCSNCQNDCGICTDPPQINIISPENKIYDTTKIDLIVSSDQNIIVWMYSLNEADPITFTPNIIITAQEGDNTITVVGINQNYQSGSSEVSFRVELPVSVCGDGTCNTELGETCSSCSQDCGSCPNNGNTDGNGGGGGGGGSPKTNIQTQTNETLVNLNLEINEDQEKESEDETTTQEQTESEQTTQPGITGAVIGFVKSGKGIGIIIAALIIIAGIIVIAVTRNKQGAEEIKKTKISSKKSVERSK